MDKNIYLDSAANTPLDKEVLNKMLPYLQRDFVGNSFALHDYGVKALMAVEDARDMIRKDLHITDHTIIFNSGATEGNNTVIQYLYEKNSTPLYPHKIISSGVEHSSIISVLKHLDEEAGAEVEYVYPSRDGSFDINDFESAIDDNTFLICLMAVNNETGACYDHLIPQIVERAHALGIKVLCDCTQYFSVGVISKAMEYFLQDVDYITFSSHKLYGPTGVGCLLVKNGEDIPELIYGGAQEEGHRGGTHNTAGIIGMANAIHNMVRDEINITDHSYSLYAHLMDGIQSINDYCSDNKINIKIIDNIESNSSRHTNIVNLQITGKSILSDFNFSDALINKGIACSAGSACDAKTSGTVYSNTLINMGLTKKEIRHSVRISFMKYNTLNDIDALLEAIRSIIKEIIG